MRLIKNLIDFTQDNVLRGRISIMEETIELKELFLIIKKHMLMICILGFIAMVISGGVSFFFLTPKFEASTQLIVNSVTENNQITNQDIQASFNLMNTYRDILRAPIILDDVIENLNLEYNVTLLQGFITASNSNNSQVLSVTVKHETPSLAQDIANEVAEVFQGKIGGIMSVENVSVLAPAEMPTRPVEPRPMMNMAIGLVVGLMIGIGATFILEYFDTKIKTEQDIEKLTGLPVLGVVATMSIEDFKNKGKV